MTVYVDTKPDPLEIPRLLSPYSHLMSDQMDPAELHAFAKWIKVPRSQFSTSFRFGSS